MNWLVIIIIGILSLALIVFLVIRNQKDEKDFEQQANNDSIITTAEDGDIGTEEQPH